MSNKKWEVKFYDCEMTSIAEGKTYTSVGYYKIFFNGLMYGIVSKEAWDNKKTNEILDLLVNILNDAHDLALRDFNKE